MSGRFSRVLLSVLLLLAVLVPALIVLPTARAAPPAVAFDHATGGNKVCTSTCAFGPISVTLDASTLVLVEIDITQQTNDYVTAVNIGGQSASLLVNYSGSGQFRQYVWYAVGVPAGTPSVGSTNTATPNHQVGYGLLSFYNVKQSAPFAQTSAKNTGSTTGTSTTATATLGSIPGTGHMMTDFAAFEDMNLVGTQAAGAGQTAQYTAVVNAGNDYVGGSTMPAAGSAAMLWTSTGIPTPGTMYWQEVVMDLAPVDPVVAVFTFTTSGLSASFSLTVIGGTAPYTYSWAFGDTVTNTTQNPTHTYTASGTYTVMITATDTGGNTGSSTQSVTVSTGGGGSTGSSPPALPPNTVTYPQLINLNCNVVTFSDPRGDAAISSTVLWAYNFGDGSPIDYSPVPDVTHTYVTPGVYGATMTAQDKQGNVQTYSLAVDTSPAGCAGAVIRGVVPPTFFGLFVALLVASFVAGRKHPKWKHRFRVGAVASFVIVISVVVLLP